MSIHDNNIFKHVVNYAGLKIEITSDNEQLLKLDFIKNKVKIKDKDVIPDPIKKALIFLDAYFRGNKSDIEIIFNSKFLKNNLKTSSDNLLLDMNNFTEKQILIYSELIKVAPGEKISYNELASRSGINNGARFAGNCMAGNRFPVILPCHRIIKRDGSIGNYTGGIEIKEFLLKHELDHSFSK